jgi:hypothetical protein
MDFGERGARVSNRADEQAADKERRSIGSPVKPSANIIEHDAIFFMNQSAAAGITLD